MSTPCASADSIHDPQIRNPVFGWNIYPLTFQDSIRKVFRFKSPLVRTFDNDLFGARVVGEEKLRINDLSLPIGFHLGQPFRNINAANFSKYFVTLIVGILPG